MDEHYDGPIEELGNVKGHHCYLYRLPSGEHRARCECNQTWTYDRSRTLEQMLEIYVSHLRYFTRKKTETL